MVTTAEALHLTDATFDNDVLKSEKLVLVDFTAIWCPPCRTLGMVMDKLSEEFEGRAVIGKIDVDENPETPMNFGVRSIPTLLFFKHGVVVDQIIGAVGKEMIAAKLAAQI